MTLAGWISIGLLLVTAIERGLTSRRIWWVPIWGVAAQIPWVAFTVWQELWGLTALAVWLLIDYARAIPKWSRTRKKGI